ncbi:MAG: hypothetical protein HY877_05460 [Deltaproteobacteria bacterium]|nr:hypothetical protein [Deltaproteobacteria bacterium]
MELRRKTRPAWEYFFVSAIVIATLWLSLALYAKRDQVYKEKILMQELATLRNEITAYVLEHRTLPKSPLSIVHSPWSPDSFGNEYHYNAETGHIQSTTASYQNW